MTSSTAGYRSAEISPCELYRYRLSRRWSPDGGGATCESVEFVVGTLKDWGQHGAEQTAANARLIAAAPDLLAACKALVEWRNDDKSGFAAFSDAGDKAHAAAVAAIAKAEGASPCDA